MARTTKQLRSKVVQFLFVRPVKIYIADVDAKLEIVERPLRASTPQGERIAIARSEALPAGTRIGFEVIVLNDVINKSCLESLLEYGQYAGLRKEMQDTTFYIGFESFLWQ